MKLPLVFAFIFQICEATSGGLFGSLFSSSNDQNGQQGNQASGATDPGNILTSIFGGSDRGKQPDILEQFGGMLNGIVNGVAQNRIDIKPFGLNISIGDILNPLSGGNGGSVSEKTSSLVGVPNTDNQHKELIARIRQKVFANCTLVPLDIVFVVDGSSSIGRLDFQVVKLFVADIADIFAGAGRFAVVQYSEYPRTEFHLAETTDMTPQQLRDRVAKISYLTGTTKTDRALKYAYENEFTSAAGNRSFAPDVVIVITDGRSQDNPEPSAKLLQQKGCTIYAIGVTKEIDKNQLLQIVGGNQDRVFTINDFTELNEQLSSKLVEKTVCATQKLTNVTAIPYVEPSTIPNLQVSTSSNLESSTIPSLQSSTSPNLESSTIPNLQSSTTSLVTSSQAPTAKQVVDPIDWSLVEKRTENDTKMYDLVFLVDSSGSIGADNFEKVKKFIVGMIESLYSDKNRFGLTQFSSQTWTEFKLQDSAGKSLQELKNLVENLTYRRGDTNLGAALEQLAKIDFAKESGNRPEVPDILIIITDGKANDFPKIPAFALMSMGVKIYAVGITKEIDVEQLKEITTDSRRVFTVPNFEDLNKELSDKIALEAASEATRSFIFVQTNFTSSAVIGNLTSTVISGSNNCTIFGERYADLCNQSQETCEKFCGRKSGLQIAFCAPHDTNSSAGEMCYCHYCKEQVINNSTTFIVSNSTTFNFTKFSERNSTNKFPVDPASCSDLIKMRYSTRLCDDGAWRCNNFCNWKYDSLLANSFCTPHETNVSAAWCCCHYCADFETVGGTKQKPDSTVNENKNKGQIIDNTNNLRRSSNNSSTIAKPSTSVDRYSIEGNASSINTSDLTPTPVSISITKTSRKHMSTDAPMVNGTIHSECGGNPAMQSFFGTEPCDIGENECSTFCHQKFEAALVRAECVADWLKPNKNRCSCRYCKKS